MLLFPLTQDSTAPLFVACQNGHSGVVSMLIRNGADINLACNILWRYNVPYTHTVNITSRFSHKAYRSLLMYMSAVLSG